MRQNFILGLLVGSITTVIGFVLYAGILLLLPLLWPGSFAARDGTWDWPGIFVMWLTVGQVVSGFASLFVAGTLGFFAIREFSEARERPILRLAFHETGGDHLTVKPVSQMQAARITLALYNDGPVVALRYQVQFGAPFMFWWDGKGTLPRIGSPVTYVAGTSGQNWRPFREVGSSIWNFNFKSSGTDAVFPKWPQVLCHLWVPTAYLGQWETLVCDYQVGTEDTIQNGKLYLQRG